MNTISSYNPQANSNSQPLFFDTWNINIATKKHKSKFQANMQPLKLNF